MKFYSGNYTPFFFIRYGGRVLAQFLRPVIAREFKLTNEDIPAFNDYFTQIVMQKGTSEFAFAIMFPKMLFSEHAIFNQLEKLSNVDMSVYYGTEDWTNTQYGGVLNSERLKEKNIKVHMIEHAGHHLYFDNPEQSVECIIEDLTSTNV